MKHASLLVAGLAILLAGCGDGSDDAGPSGGSDKPQLVVSAASSMKEALTACAEDYRSATLRMQFAGSDELAAQIRQGVKPDVYAAANTRLPQELNAEGLLSKPVEFASNELVLAVPADSEIAGLADLTPDGTKIAIGSEDVPIGEYTRGILAELPARQEQAILANVRSNEPDVKGIVGKLTQGAADAGFVYITDVNAAGEQLRALALPARLDAEATYAAGVVEEANEPAQGQAFVDELVEGPCATALAEAGFGPAP